jgi:hypothetical protein
VIALAELIERFEPALLQRYHARLLPSQHQALAAMKRCRTRFAPRMLSVCAACGEQRSVPHSCGHRACPHCQHHDSQVWLQRQLQSLVPATYFLVTFTLPAELRGLAWSHQRVVYALMMQCAWDTLATFSRNDPKLRATPGAVGVLHTHNRRLDFHPHVHMVMPAAALDTQRKLWRTKKRRSKSQRGSALSTQGGGYLFNHKALAKVFRAKVLDAIERAGLRLPDKLPSTWVVDCRCVGDGSKALLYLGRYLYRGVIQEADILRCEDGHVTFRYRDAKTDRMALRTLPGADFLWLVLQHVLPKGLRRARNFGFLHPNSAGAIRLLQVLHLRAARAADGTAAPPRPAWRCACGQPMHVVRRRMPALQPDGRLDEHTPSATPIASPEVEVHDKVHDRPDKPVTQQAHPMH